MPVYTYPDPDRLREFLLVYLLHADGPTLLQTRTDLAHLSGVSEEDIARTYAEYEPTGSSDQSVWKAMIAREISALQETGLMTKKGDVGHRFDRQDLTEAGCTAARALEEGEAQMDIARLREATVDEGSVADADLPKAIRLKTMTYRFLRDTTAAREAKRLARYVCQVCGLDAIRLPDGSPYAEAHHVTPLYRGGPDQLSNLLCVCPTCHARLDYLALEIVPHVAQQVAHLDDRHVRGHNQRVREARR